MCGCRSIHESKSHASNGQIQKNPFFTKSSQSGIQKKQETPFFQAKLNIGQPNDKYEKEADAVANTVVNKKSESPALQPKISSIPQVQAKCTDCEKKKEEKGTVQTKSETGGGTASPQLSSNIQSSAGKGNALPKKSSLR